MAQPAGVVRFNRTFMELKLGTGHNREQMLTRFNRTFMELKLVICSHNSLLFLVLIAPLWN